MSNESIILEELLQGPSLPAPPGVSYNFQNPSNLDNWFIFTVASCLGVSTFALSIRLYTQAFIVKKWNFEDYLFVLGYFMLISYSSTVGLVIYNGGGVHQWDVQLKHAIKAFYYIYVTEQIYGILTTILKSTILIQYRRIFAPTSKTDLMFWGTHLLNAIIFGFYITVTFFVMFQCHPREKAWNPLIKGGTCFNNNAIVVASGYCNVITDFAILLLPQKVIWGLHMPLRKKLAVSGIFLVGLFACITSVIRLIYSYQVERTGDVTYTVGKMGLWTLAEIASCILCGCLPLFPKFFQNLMAKYKPRTETGYSSWKPPSTWSFSGKRTRAPRKHRLESYQLSQDSCPSRASLKRQYYGIDEQELERGVSSNTDVAREVPLE